MNAETPLIRLYFCDFILQYTHLILFICDEEEFLSFLASICITYTAITKLICRKEDT